MVNLSGLASAVRDGGLASAVAAGFAALGVLVALAGAVAFVASRRLVHPLGVAALALGALAAGSGLAGTVALRRSAGVELAAIENEAAREYRLRPAHAAAAASAEVGAWGGGLAATLGLLVALVGVAGGRRASPSSAEPAPSPPAADRGRLALVGVAAVLSLGLVGGAARVGASERPAGRYPVETFGRPPFSDHETRAWDVAIALEVVKKYPDRGCDALDAALSSFDDGEGADRARRDRALEGVSPDWRPTARRCATRMAENIRRRAPGEACVTRLPGTYPPDEATLLDCLLPLPWTLERLRTSPLVHDDATWAEITGAASKGPPSR